jgi:hypothetical protein
MPIITTKKHSFVQLTLEWRCDTIKRLKEEFVPLCGDRSFNESVL